MWLADPIPLEVSRVADILIGLQFFDEDTDLPLDLTGFTFSAKVAMTDGEASFYSPAVTVDDVINGSVNVNFAGTGFSSVAGPTESVTLAYQIIATADAIDVIAMRGPLTLSPGI